MELAHEEIALRKGIESLGNFEIEKAVKAFQDTAKEFPEAGIVWLYLGDAFLLLHEIKKAKGAHKKSVGFDSELWYPRLINTPVAKGIEHRILFGEDQPNLTVLHLYVKVNPKVLVS